MNDAPLTAWQELLEKDDRTSPEEYPEMALITSDELTRYIHGSFKGGMHEAVKILRDAALLHEAENVASKKVVESEANLMAARILRSYANGIEIEADKPLP